MKPANLGEGDLTLTVNDYQGRYSSDPKAGCSLSPYWAIHVEA